MTTRHDHEPFGRQSWARYAHGVHALLRLKRVPSTIVLVAANVVAWVRVAADSPRGIFRGLVSTHDGPTLLRFGAADRSTLQTGEVWRLLTAQFLHAKPLHLLFNLTLLLVLGLAFEERWQRGAFAVAYTLSGTAGLLLSVLVLPTLISSGASQAILGVGGVATVDLLHHRSWAAARPPLIALVAGLILVQVGLDLTASDSLLKPGHLSGLVVGLMIGWPLTSRIRGGRTSADPHDH